ncbi:DNA polymerase-3 subunit epsilon [Alteribacillus persepolensis]|uniref:DNA polymerase-3 subunit epsilon n=1 Tax=Alteribacillus persepolensis TaxID=568899 RepID=A0A1G8HAU0_9BACI|nr:3'-5' exonuclease [Alteribacillus persepolensis]SDI03610.1 DNA polymerase-3 subunit epsilon [Alteribacillus persepolensis]
MFKKKKTLPYQINQEIPLDTPLSEITFTVFDTETTGFAVGTKDRLIEIGAVQVEGLKVTNHTFQTYVHPNRDIPQEIVALTGIHEKNVQGAPNALNAVESLFQFVETHHSACWVGHYAAFDMVVLKKELQREKYAFKQPQYIDTLDLIGCLNPSWDMRDLNHYARQFGSKMFERHSALGDALTTAHLFVELVCHLHQRGKTRLGDVLDATRNDYGTTKI